MDFFKSKPKDIELPQQGKRDPRLPPAGASPLSTLKNSWDTFKTFSKGGTEALKGLQQAGKK